MFTSTGTSNIKFGRRRGVDVDLTESLQHDVQPVLMDANQVGYVTSRVFEIRKRFLDRAVFLSTETPGDHSFLRRRADAVALLSRSVPRTRKRLGLSAFWRQLTNSFAED